MKQCRGFIEKYLTEYEKNQNIDMNSRISHLHAIIDRESIKYNLSANEQREMSDGPCEKLSANNFSYIVRRQLILLTDKQRTTLEPALTTDEVEQIVNFACNPENTDITKACSRLSQYERWTSGFDAEASRILAVIRKRYPDFKFTGTFLPPYPSSASVIKSQAIQLIDKMRVAEAPANSVTDNSVNNYATTTESTMATTNTLTTTTTMTMTMTMTNATASDNSVNKDDTQTIHAQ